MHITDDTLSGLLVESALLGPQCRTFRSYAHEHFVARLKRGDLYWCDDSDHFIVWDNRDGTYKIHWLKDTGSDLDADTRLLCETILDHFKRGYNHAQG